MRTSGIALLVAAWCLLVPVGALAVEPTVEERLRALEERVRALEEENAKLRAQADARPAPPPAPEAAAPPAAPAAKPQGPAPPVFAKAAGKEQELKIGGFLQVQAEAGGRPDLRFSDDHDRVALRRARVNVQGRLLERLEWRTEMELAGTLANSSGLRAQLTDAYVHWSARPGLGLRAGQFKTPYGHEFLFADVRLSAIERTLGTDRLTLGRQAGVQLGGSASKERLTWALGAFNGTAANTSGNDDDRFLVASRVSGVPATWTIDGRDARWSVGVSGFTSEDRAVTMGPELGFDSTPATTALDNVFAGRRRGLGADTQLLLGRVQVQAEWLGATFRPDSALPAAEVEARARMAQATWMAWRDRLELMARWDEFDPSRATPHDEWRAWTTGLSWLVRGHDLKLQADWLDVHGPEPHGDGSRLLLRLQVLF